MKIKLSLLLVAVVMGFLLWFQTKRLNEANTSISVLENNVNSLSQGITTFKVKDSLNAVSLVQLNMRTGEAEKLVDSLTFVCKDLDVKYKNLRSYVDMYVQSTVEVKIPVYDTVYLGHDAVFINYHTKWNSLVGVVYDNKFEGKIGCNHEIKILDEEIYKGWWNAFFCQEKNN